MTTGEVIALIKAFGSGGGGSSGGGVLVVHTDEDTHNILDKTWQEIHDAVESGKIVIIEDSGAINYVTLVRDAAHAETVPGKYNVEFVSMFFNGWDSDEWAYKVVIDGYVCVCDTANDYPTQYTPDE